MLDLWSIDIISLALSFPVNEVPLGYQGSSHVWEELMGSLNSFKEVLNRLRMYGNGYSMATVLDHRSTALTETKIGEC